MSTQNTASDNESPFTLLSVRTKQITKMSSYAGDDISLEEQIHPVSLEGLISHANRMREVACVEFHGLLGDKHSKEKDIEGARTRLEIASMRIQKMYILMPCRRDLLNEVQATRVIDTDQEQKMQTIVDRRKVSAEESLDGPPCE